MATTTLTDRERATIYEAVYSLEELERHARAQVEEVRRRLAKIDGRLLTDLDYYGDTFESICGAHTLGLRLTNALSEARQSLLLRAAGPIEEPEVIEVD